MGNPAYVMADDRLTESYAVGIAYVFSKSYYTNGQIPGGNWQNVTFEEMINFYESKYTPLVIDLMDNFNQRSVRGNTYPIDNVSGYTIAQIENAIKGAKTLEKWRDNLRDKYDNSTENNLDELFNNYINFR